MNEVCQQEVSMLVRGTLISVLWLLAHQPPVYAQSTNWFTLSPAKGGFSIRFPTKPEDMSLDRKTPQGLIHYSIWAEELADRAFNLTFIDMPHLTASEGESLVDSNLVSQIAVHIGGKLLGEKEAQIAGHPGKEFTLAMDGGNVLFRGRVFMVGVRQFTVSVYGDANRSTNDDFTFLNSFQLVTNAPPSKAAGKDGH
jgi:hypothetical protein